MDHWTTYHAATIRQERRHRRRKAATWAALILAGALAAHTVPKALRQAAYDAVNHAPKELNQ